MAEITLLPDNVRFPLIPGKTVLESAEDQAIKLPFGCRAGACGACFIYVLTGLDQLPEPSPVELDTLTKIKRLGQGRLACRLKNVSQPISIQRRTP